MSAVRAENVHFSYSSKPVLAGVSFDIQKGEFVGIIGKTGCGKSTLLLTLNGVIPKMINGVFSGKVEVLGKDAAHLPVHELARSVAFVFQDPDEQIFSLRAEDEILFGLQNIGVAAEEAKKRAEKALKTVGLSDCADCDPHKLSHGQKQKLAFACALAVEPEIFVLDEPVSSLDHLGSMDIYALLDSQKRRGKTIIVSEHDTEWLAEHASRVLFLNNGQIEADGGPELLLEKRIERAGIKVPCAAKISKRIGEKFLTPNELSVYLAKRRRK